MSTALTPQLAENSELVARQPDLLSLILSVVRDPTIDVDKVRALIDMKREMDAQGARDRYWAGMKACQDEIRAVVKDRKNPDNGAMYAQLETIDLAIRQVYKTHGFTISWNPGAKPHKDGDVCVQCMVSHDAGHIESYQLEAPPDNIGPKGGATKTVVQGIVSTVSYMKRILLCSVFNVPLKNADKDGSRNYVEDAPISAEQAMQIRDMITAAGMDQSSEAGFLKFIGAGSIEKIPASRFGDALKSLRVKAAKNRGAL